MNIDTAIHVLHVDDEPDLADMTGTFLEREDDRITVETATSAGKGIDRLADVEFDCIVSDYDMPGMDGIEFLEAVREDHPELPFILFTGRGSEEVASEAITAGVTDYLQKEGGSDQYTILANRIQNTVEQYRATQSAAELDRIRTLASTVNQVLVRVESRVEAETRICEIFSDSDPYLFAWIGEVDRETNRLEPQASAGFEEGYLDDITITTDETATGRGPGGTAIRERRIAICQNIADHPEFEPWREKALERGYQSVAAVPLEHDGTLYGALVVYAERPDVFDDTERNLLAKLGDDISHAFHSFDVRNQLRKERDQREALLENAPVPVNVAEIRDVGDAIVLTSVNDAFEEVFGYDAEEVVGKDPAELFVPERDMDRHQEFRKRVCAGDTIITEVERFTADGSRTFLLHIIPYGFDGNRADGLYAWYTDISEHREREQTIEELHHAANALMEASALEEVAQTATDAVTDILDMPANGVHLYDETEGGLVPVAWTEQTEEIVGQPPTFTPGEGIAGRAFEAGEPQIYDDISTVADRYNPDTPVRSQIIYPLADHGVLVIGSPAPDAFDDTDASLAKIVATQMTTALDRIDYERKLRALHEVADDLTTADSVEEICQRTIDASQHLLAFDLSIISIEEGGILVPMAVSEDISLDEVTAMSIEEGIAGKAYRRNESFLINDVDACDDVTPQGPFKSGISIPVGEHGNFQIIAETTDAFDESDLQLAELLINHTESALERLFREQDFQRKNERLSKFVSVVSHDLRNPLNVVEARLELAREECDSRHLGDAANAVDRSLTLIDDLLTLAREGEEVSEFEPVDLSETIEGCWQTVETKDATLVTETDRMIRADASRVKQLLENLIRNVVEHGGDDVTITIGDFDDGFYVADDGPGISEDERERVFEAGYSTTEDGTGFGLNIVQEITEEHGWQISVAESKDGGARFEITGVEFA